MEGIQNKKRCRKIDSAGDKKDLAIEVKSNEAAGNEIVQDSQSPKQKRRRTILSQKVEDNVIENTSKNKGISKQLAVKISVNENTRASCLVVEGIILKINIWIICE